MFKFVSKITLEFKNLQKCRGEFINLRTKGIVGTLYQYRC